MPPKNTPEIFWSRVAILDDIDACWEWTASTFEFGYGKISWNCRHQCAHRIAYQLFYGVDPGELEVCHKCDNPPCCNPHHLFLGTHLDNVRDMIAKGRGICKPGENNGAAKLTAAIVADIRARYAVGNILQKELAAEYDVSAHHIADIIKGRRWPSTL